MVAATLAATAVTLGEVVAIRAAVEAIPVEAVATLEAAAGMRVVEAIQAVAVIRAGAIPVEVEIRAVEVAILAEAEIQVVAETSVAGVTSCSRRSGFTEK